MTLQLCRSPKNLSQLAETENGKGFFQWEVVVESILSKAFSQVCCLVLNDIEQRCEWLLSVGLWRAGLSICGKDAHLKIPHSIITRKDPDNFYNAFHKWRNLLNQDPHVNRQSNGAFSYVQSLQLRIQSFVVTSNYKSFTQFIRVVPNL